jgi:hypothetical protein
MQLVEPDIDARDFAEVSDATELRDRQVLGRAGDFPVNYAKTITKNDK